MKAHIAAPSGVTQLHHHKNCLRALFTELFSSPQLCVGRTWFFKSPCLHSRARQWRRNSAGTTYVVQGLFSKGFRPTSALCSPRSCSVALLCRRVRLVSKAILLSAVTSRTCTSATCDSCSRRCITDQVPRGRRAPLDHFRLLLIDWPAVSVESSPPVRGGTWCRSRKHQSPAHSADSSRGSLRRHALWTHFDLPVEAVMPCWHHHHQLAPLTHLELRVEDHCRSSFLLTQAVLCCIHCLGVPQFLHSALLGCC